MDFATTLAADDPRVRISHDARYRICAGSLAHPGMDPVHWDRPGGRRAWQIKCVYVPAMG